jgi:prefoldin subunit 5
MRDQALARLDELKRQYQMGEGQLRELGRQEAALRETLLRITGAIQVLEELLGSSPEATVPGSPEAKGPLHQEIDAIQDGNRGTGEPLTVP